MEQENAELGASEKEMLTEARENTRKILALKAGDDIVKAVFTFGRSFLQSREVTEDAQHLWADLRVLALMEEETSLGELVTGEAWEESFVILLDLVLRSQVEYLRVASIQYEVMRGFSAGIPGMGGEENDR